MRYTILVLCFITTISFADKEKELIIKKLSDNVYQHISHKVIEPWGLVAASGLVVIDNNNAHIIDTPWTLAGNKQLLTWIKAKNLIVKSAVVTHFHEDASKGLKWLNSLNIDAYALPLTNKLLASKEREQSSHEITSDSFELASGAIEIFHPGAGHSQDNIVVWLPKNKLLFGGCFTKSLSSKNLGNTEDAIIEDWPSSIDNVLKKYPNIKTVVPGHGKIGDTSLLKHTKELAISLSALK